ncbi:hypothetical protein [Silanimonas sp.]|uniref:hypothetical protein n=1 Tax=Silanimonas sp. TaxID=1929290 RepID=UPI0022BAA96D|nr:hypothetical protein [Silanimonas sp.]MCZ8165412.1 hypothetical protein [Silanimonas sp.]
MKLWIGGAAIALAHGVIAADAPPAIGSIEPAALVQQLDRNANGCLDLEEGRNYTSRRFHALDANGDNVLDAAEAPPLPGEPSAARPIGIEAWQDAYTARFNGFDADGSSCLSAEEITQGRAAAATGGAR